MIKKLIFFLLACNEQQVLLFFKRYGNKQKEEKTFSFFFLKKLKKHFKQLKQINNDLKDSKNNIFFYWRTFCQKSLMEEIIILILCSILKIPENKVAWLLKIPPRLVVFRLQQGLQSLGEEIEQSLETKFSEQEEYKIKALEYCQKLSEQKLPEKLETFQVSKKFFLSIKWFFLLLSILIGLIIFSLYKKNKTVILYQSFLIQKTKVFI